MFINKRFKLLIQSTQINTSKYDGVEYEVFEGEIVMKNTVPPIGMNI